MRIEDVTVEVRSSALGALAIVDLDYVTDFVGVKRQCNVGSWSMSLPAEYDVSSLLAAPGRGIIVRGPKRQPDGSVVRGVLFSGSVVTYEKRDSNEDILGRWYFTGVDDNIHLSDGLAFPDPSNDDATTQTESHDVRTGDAETVLRAYFSYNIGPDAQVSRAVDGLALEAVNLERGATVTGRARFAQLGKLMSDLATVGGIGFDLLQDYDSDTIVLSVYEPQDRTGEVQMDIMNDLLRETKYGFSAPRATRAIVAGQGEGVDRTFIVKTSIEAGDAETAWRRKIEVFKDRRDTNDTGELEQEGSLIVDENGKTITSLSVVPADRDTMQYAIDWNLGDLVTVVVDGDPLSAVVTEALISISAEGVQTAATVGDPVGFDFQSRLTATQKNQGARLDALERSEASAGASLPVGGTTGQVLAKQSATDGDADWETITPTTYQITNNIGDPQFTWALANATAPPYCVWLEGQVLSRTTYAALFEKYNPVVGTTTVTIATPGVFTLTAHGMLTGQMVYLTTTGALPTGLAANTNYWVIWITANTFSLATSEANAKAGTAIATTGTQSGVHTLRTTFGVGNGTTTFNVPDPTGKALVGQKATGAFAFGQGVTVGEETHVLTTAELASHQHGPGSNLYFNTIGASGSRQTLVSGGSWWVTTTTTLSDVGSSTLTAAAGGGGAHNNVQPSLIGRYYARYADVVLPPAGSTASVTAVPGTVAQRDAAGRTQAVAGAVATDVAIVEQLPNPNLVRNGSFRTNQRGYVTNTDLALNAYGFDGWKATTANSRMTFTAAPQGQAVTIPAGDSWGQVIERANIDSGSHTVSQAGTAQARIYNVGATPPAYATCPVTATLDGLADVIVEFGNGTISQVKVERGSVATPFVLDEIGVELGRCYRYFQKVTSPTSFIMSSAGAFVTTTLADIPVQLIAPMRASPTVVFANVNVYDAVSIYALSAHTVRNVPSPTMVVLRVTATTTSAIGRPAMLMGGSPNGLITFDAEL